MQAPAFLTSCPIFRCKLEDLGIIWCNHCGSPSPNPHKENHHHRPLTDFKLSSLADAAPGSHLSPQTATLAPNHRLSPPKPPHSPRPSQNWPWEQCAKTCLGAELRSTKTFSRSRLGGLSHDLGLADHGRWREAGARPGRAPRGRSHRGRRRKSG